MAQCHLAGSGGPGKLPRSPFATKSDFLTTSLPAAGVAAVVSAVEGLQGLSASSGGGIDLTGGAINQVAAADNAFVHRDTTFLIQYNTNWVNGAAPAVVDANVAWLRQAWASLRPFTSGQAYQNYADPELAGWQQAYYGTNLARLRATKAAYDADDVFRFPQSIPLP